jgi:hypothetical protein
MITRVAEPRPGTRMVSLKDGKLAQSRDIDSGSLALFLKLEA